MAFSLPEQQTNYVALASAIVISSLLMISWLAPELRLIWNQIDTYVFRVLNNSLQEKGFWTDYWAWMNYRLVDLVVLLIMASLMMSPNKVFKAGNLQLGLFGFVVTLFFMLICRELFDALIDKFQWNRASPTLVLDNVVRLSELYPDLHPKDSSATSFPGDHAGVLMLWTGYCWSFARNKWSFVVLFIALFFSLPRLVGGGHWLSDDIVGGGVIALMTLTFVRYTPLYYWLTTKLVAWFQPVFVQLLRYMPALNQFAFFSKG